MRAVVRVVLNVVLILAAVQAVVVLCAYIARPTRAAQKYPDSFFNFSKSLTYFWDSRTNLCFAYFEVLNGYGNPMAFPITNVPCTASVRALINSNPPSLPK